MVEVRPATADEMILAFLQADIETTDPARRKWFADALTARAADRTALIHRGDPRDPQQNAHRRYVIGVRGYTAKQALFTGFPADASWRLVNVTPDEVKKFRYANHLPNWIAVSGGTRLVGDALTNLGHEPSANINGNVVGIATRLRQGERFPPLIAAQVSGADELVLIEGHHRSTAYALTGLPDQIPVFIGASVQMRGWHFF